MKLLKYLSLGLLTLLLLAVLMVVWLRYEFARISSDPAGLEAWNEVAVEALEPGAAAQPSCAQQHPLRKAFFGALHVHTAASYDSTAFDVTTTADEAYRFGRGEALPLRLRGDPPEYVPPVVSIGVPLDFMAVTDHAETLGENRLCYTPQSPSYNALVCRLFRGDLRLPVQEHLQSIVRLASLAIFGQDRSARLCGQDGARCREWSLAAWRDNQRSAERWLDRSESCGFTTFHAYEYTLAEAGSNLHRNVVFRSEVVPQAPLSAKDAPRPELLWDWLQRTCVDGSAACDALAIPHNSNWSSGRMFHPYSNLDLPEAERTRQAALRAALEPLAEIMQVKGDSECRNGIASVYGAADELCDFEKLRPPGESIPDCGEERGSGGMTLKGCVSRYSYLRYSLTAGLSEREKLGINPFRFGIVAATDTHTGMPAAGLEANHPGSHGNDRDPARRLLAKVEVPGDIATGSPVRYNPGGVAGVFAQENSRGALFDAMRRRETFGTSGPRITPRFFAGWRLPEDICQSPDYLEIGYRDGVPMGQEIPPAPDDAAAGPLFTVSASRDPRDGSQLLQRIQVVKGWVDGQGRTHQAVYDVAGDPGNGASVDPDTCAVSGPGYSQLCATWRDPDFDPSTAAVYYARVLENPSCRWSRHTCLALPEGQRPPSCADPQLPWQIQERAWTSPVWYYPVTASSMTYDNLRARSTGDRIPAANTITRTAGSYSRLVPGI